MYRYVCTDIFPEEWTSAQRVALKEESLQYVIHNHILFHIHHINNKMQFESAVRQLCLPQAFRERIMYELHNAHGHQSGDKTFINILGRYYWPTMYKDILIYCNSCAVCLSRKSHHHVSPLPVLSPQRDSDMCDEIGGVLAIDWVALLTKGMFTIVDLASRYAVAVPMPKASINIALMLCLFTGLISTGCRARSSVIMGHALHLTL